MAKILLGLAVILSVSIIAFKASGAYLSDAEKTTNNNFSAGTFNISDDTNTFIPFSFSNLRPGDHVSKIVGLKNVGTIDISYIGVIAANKTGDIGFLDQIIVTPALDGANILGSSIIHPNDVYNISFDFTVPNNIGPQWQGKSMQFDLEFNAKQ